MITKRIYWYDIEAKKTHSLLSLADTLQRISFLENGFGEWAEYSLHEFKPLDYLYILNAVNGAYKKSDAIFVYSCICNLPIISIQI